MEHHLFAITILCKHAVPLPHLCKHHAHKNQSSSAFVHHLHGRCGPYEPVILSVTEGHRQKCRQHHCSGHDRSLSCHALCTSVCVAELELRAYSYSCVCSHPFLISTKNSSQVNQVMLTNTFRRISEIAKSGTPSKPVFHSTRAHGVSCAHHQRSRAIRVETFTRHSIPHQATRK
jgi:hypothetical protein